MINEQQSQVIERFAFEGLLSGSGATAAWLVVAIVAGWLLWRERRRVGPGWATTFWLLRMTALGVVLWMLAGPTHVEITRLVSPQSIALLVDSSQSMDAVDPPHKSEDLRWEVAASKAASGSIVARCDRVEVILAEAASAAEQVTDAIAQHQPSSKLQAAGEEISTLAERARKLLDTTSDDVRKHDTRLAGRAERIATLLDEPLETALEAFRAEAQDGDAAVGVELTETAAALTDLVGSLHRRSRSLAAAVAERLPAAESQSTIADDRSRRQRVGDLLTQLEAGPLGEISRQVNIRRFRFDRRLQSVDPSMPEAWKAAIDPQLSLVSYTSGENDNQADLLTTPATDISGALATVAGLQQSESLRMVLLLSDGRHNATDAAAPQDLATRFSGLPVHVVPVGVTTPPRDVLIHRVEAPSAVVQNDTADIEVMVSAYDCEGEQLDVTLRRDGEELERKTIQVTRDRIDQRLKFRIKGEELGLQQYEIEVEPATDEASLTNNLSVAAIEVVRDKIRVLLADRAPRWEHRYLVQLFRRDEHIEFDEFLTLPNLRATGGLAAAERLPESVEDWSRYDIVILGDLGPKHLSDETQESLSEYVRKRSGNLILIAGREHMPHSHRLGPLMDLAPVENSGPIDTRTGFAIALDPQAQLTSAVMIRDSFKESEKAWLKAYRSVPLYGLSPYSQPKPNAQTLVHAVPLEQTGRLDLTDNRRALLCWANVGTGRVVYLAAPQSYVLRFRQGDRDHHRFWGQTLRWVTAAQTGAGTSPVRIEADRTNYELGEEIAVTVWLQDERGRPVADVEFSVEARVLDEATATATMRPDGEVAGRYVGSFPRLPIGTFRLEATGEIIEDLFSTAKQNRPTEGSDAASEADTNVSGTYITVESSGSIELANTESNRPLLEQIATLTGGHILPPTAVEEVLRLTSLDPEVSETPRRTPLWNRWSNLLIVLGCLLTEWVVRKQKGLT